MRVRHSASALALMLAIAAPAAAHAKSDTPDYTYVLLGAQGPIARAIYSDATDCPSIKADDKDQPMNARIGDKTAFPVLVCEFLVPAGTKKLELKGKKLPLPPDTLESVAVIGDTGCRIGADSDNDSDDSQDCDKVSDWPFSQLAASVAKRTPQGRKSASRRCSYTSAITSTARSRRMVTTGTPGCWTSSSRQNRCLRPRPGSRHAATTRSVAATVRVSCCFWTRRLRRIRSRPCARTFSTQSRFRSTVSSSPLSTQALRPTTCQRIRTCARRARPTPPPIVRRPVAPQTPMRASSPP